MVPEVLRYKIPAQQTEAFERDYAQAGESLKASPHCLGFELLRSGKDPELYLLKILWDSAEGHLQGFRQSEQFRSFLGHIRAYIPNLLEMEHYGATEVQWSR